jgi:hypothetical protein
MHPSIPPKVTGVEVVATQPTAADTAAIAHLSVQASRSLPPIAYLVKVRFETPPPVTSEGWALYVDNFRIPKYWEYRHGIYFKVFDAQFFADHKGQQLRFSQNGSDFIDTGIRLSVPAPIAEKPRGKSRSLPLQADLLK